MFRSFLLRTVSVVDQPSILLYILYPLYIIYLFNQGNEDFFGVPTRRQCACNGFYSICWSIIRKISIWKPLGFDHTLIESDKFC